MRRKPSKVPDAYQEISPLLQRVAGGVDGGENLYYLRSLIFHAIMKLRRSRDSDGPTYRTECDKKNAREIILTARHCACLTLGPRKSYRRKTDIQLGVLWYAYYLIKFYPEDVCAFVRDDVHFSFLPEI